MRRAGNEIVAHASADWAGHTTRYERRGPGAARVSKEVALRGHGDAVRFALADLGVTEASDPATRSAAVVAVGHRIVHGGEFNASVRITPEVRSRIAALVELAPLHNPPG